MVHLPNEYEHWAKKGKVRKPDHYNWLISSESVMLKPGEEFDLLFKLFTLREVSIDPKAEATEDVIK